MLSPMAGFEQTCPAALALIIWDYHMWRAHDVATHVVRHLDSIVMGRLRLEVIQAVALQKSTDASFMATRVTSLTPVIFNT